MAKAKSRLGQLPRCAWVNSDPLYQRYHDEEWGVPLTEDLKLFEFITLESMQAYTILKKRENYRKAFAQFDPVRVSRFTESKVNSLMQNAGIVRNEAKIRAVINNAKCFLDIQREFGSFWNYSWQFVNGKPRINEWTKSTQIPAITAESEAFAKNLKARGFKFLGPTTVYAHMQAAGMVNDHLKSCFRYNEINRLIKKPRRTRGA